MKPSTSLGTRSKGGTVNPSPLVRQAGNIRGLLRIHEICRRSILSSYSHVKDRCRCRDNTCNPNQDWERLVLPILRYLHGCSCLHAEMRNVCPISPPSQPENGQSLMILGFTTTSMYTSKRGIISKLSNL